MRCPTCGQPDVRIRGDRWECTWCLDVGFLPSEVRRLRDQAREAAAREVESWLEWEENAARRAGQLALEAVYAALKLLPPLAEREDLAWKAVICQATMALSYGDLRDIRWVSSPDPESARREFYPYREVVYDLEKTSGLFGPGRQKKTCLPAYWKEGGLALNHCGTFWKYIIAALPPCPEGEDPAFPTAACFSPGRRMPRGSRSTRWSGCWTTCARSWPFSPERRTRRPTPTKISCSVGFPGSGKTPGERMGSRQSPNRPQAPRRTHGPTTARRVRQYGPRGKSRRRRAVRPPRFPINRKQKRPLRGSRCLRRRWPSRCSADCFTAPIGIRCSGS